MTTTCLSHIKKTVGLRSVYNVTVHHIAGANMNQSMLPVCSLKGNYKDNCLGKTLEITRNTAVIM
jgi:hypothetical protein